MNKIKLMLRLLFRKIQYRKKNYLIYTLTLFLTSIFVMVTFFAMDTFQEYQVVSTQDLTGNWEVRYSYAQILEMNGFDRQTETDYINSELKDIRFEAVAGSLDLDNTAISIYAESVFDDSIPIRMTEGTYPTAREEVILPEKLADSLSIQPGDPLIYKDETASVTAKVVGLFRQNDLIDTVNIYTYDPSLSRENAFKVYANFMDAGALERFSQSAFDPLSPYELNTPLIQMKYEGNRRIRLLFICFTAFVLFCCICLVVNVVRLIQKEDTAYFKQLADLGAGKSFIRGYRFAEIVLAGMISVVSGFVLSGFMAFAAFSAFKGWMDDALFSQLTIRMQSEHFLFTVCFFVFLIVLCYLLTLILSRRRSKQGHVKWRFKKLDRLPLPFELSIVDLLRRGQGILMVFILCIVSFLFFGTTIFSTNWIRTVEEQYSIDCMVSSTIDLWNPTVDSVSKINEELDTILRQNKGDEISLYTYSLNLKGVVQSHPEWSVEIFTLDPATQKEFYNRYGMNEDRLLLIDHHKNDGSGNILDFEVFDQGQNSIGRFQMNCETVFDENQLIPSGSADCTVLVPASTMKEWIRTYPESIVSIEGTFNPKNKEELISSLEDLDVQMPDQIYVYDHEGAYDRFNRDALVVRSIIGFFYFVITGISLFILSNSHAQYCESHKNDFHLLYSMGASRKKIQFLYGFQSMVYSLISLFIMMAGILIVQRIGVRNLSTFSFSPFIYGVFGVYYVLLCMMMFYITNRNVKRICRGF